MFGQLTPALPVSPQSEMLAGFHHVPLVCSGSFLRSFLFCNCHSETVSHLRARAVSLCTSLLAATNTGVRSRGEIAPHHGVLNTAPRPPVPPRSAPAPRPLLTPAPSRLPGGGSRWLLFPAHMESFPVCPPPPALRPGPGPHLRVPNVPPEGHICSNRPRSGF